MKQSLTLIPTMREVPSSVDSKSLNMLIRAGYLRQGSSGVYSYLPLAKRLIRNIESIVREEIEAIGAIEFAISNLQSIDLWKQSNRFYSLKDDVFTVNNHQLLLAPSHEEEVIHLIRDEINSLKKFPLILYQNQTKYRNALKTRNRQLRSSEYLYNFIYSFHSNEECLDHTYDLVVQAYSTIIRKLGLPSELIKAGAGSIVGNRPAHKFMILAESGESIIVKSGDHDLGESIEVAKTFYTTIELQNNLPLKELEKVATPNLKTIEDVCAHFNIDSSNCIKSLVYNVDSQIVVVLVRGDDQVNESKLRNSLQAASIQLAKEKEIQKVLGCSMGAIGPVKLPLSINVVADHSIKLIQNAVAGANEDGFHYINVNPERDFAINQYEDIRYVTEGEPSADGQATLEFIKGIEIGHTIKAGDYFSEKFGANFIDEQGSSSPIMMGSYSLDITTLLTVLAETNQDELGFVWPKNLSPYDIHLIPVNREDEDQWNLANELHNILTSYHFEVLFDDRDESPAVKFNDSDLIGLPIRVTIGEQSSVGIVEVKIRQSGESFECAKEELIDRLNELFSIKLI